MSAAATQLDSGKHDASNTQPSKLAAALVKAQKAMRPAVASKINPAFPKSKYADLFDVMDVAQGPLNDNGLAVSQSVANDINGVSVTTTLLHESGEKLVSEPCWLPVSKKDPQGYGSAITYARRYSAAALLGIVVDKDDDGNAASGRGQQEVPPPAGLAAVKQHLGSAAQRPNPSPPKAAAPDDSQATHDRSMSFAFGRDKGVPLHKLEEGSLKWFESKLLADIEDPAKERWHEKTRQQLTTLRAELAFRGL